MIHVNDIDRCTTTHRPQKRQTKTVRDSAIDRKRETRGSEENEEKMTIKAEDKRQM